MLAVLPAFHSLTGQETPVNASALADSFAIGLGWNPSYFSSTQGDAVSNGHLIVEYGLENTAVLSFLKNEYDSISQMERLKLLSVSYNNLVDWHIIIDRKNCNLVFNRSSIGSQVVNSQRLQLDNIEAQLRSEAFEQILGRKPSTNVQALDDALMQTISTWKRKISNELYNAVTNKSLSNLFNTIIFIRAIEDTERRYNTIDYNYRILDALLFEQFSTEFSLKSFFESCISTLQRGINRAYDIAGVIDFDSLHVFNGLAQGTFAQLFNDFYGESQISRYRYDFSIMSKHALARVYEKYISILYVEEDPQLSFLPSMPIEKSVNKTFGAYYTPEFIAKFFARYIKQEFSVQSLKKKKIMEPAVGSGIFLRTILEAIYEENLDKQTMLGLDKSHFNSVYGVDVDENATQATKLSLALLNLVLFDNFPEQLNIVCADSLDWFKELPETNGGNKFDIFVSNPPFIRYDEQSNVLRNRLKLHLGDLSSGKPDLYFAFIKLAIDHLNPGGLGLFVLPNNFLLSQSAKKLRAYLSEHAIIRLWADLSDIVVFEAAVYVTLLIFQKKDPGKLSNKKVTVLKCRASVGKALQLAIGKNFTSTKNYDIYELPQSAFQGSSWTVLNLREFTIKKFMEVHPPIDKFLDVKQGFGSGRDEVFIRDKASIPRGEEGIYKKHNPDKQIFAYNMPLDPTLRVLYPFEGERKLTQDDIRLNYPKTWDYLVANRTPLTQRKTAKAEWWMPTNPRKPVDINKPKIVTPHLTISPRFALDITGEIHVSHSPYLKVKDETDLELLYYFTAVLNSTPCFWYIAMSSHKMGHSYAMIEVKTLKDTPVPNPQEIDRHDLLTLIRLCKIRISQDGKPNFEIDRQIDEIVCRLYNFNERDTNFLLGVR